MTFLRKLSIDRLTVRRFAA